MNIWRKHIDNENSSTEIESLSETVELILTVLKVEGTEVISFKGFDENKVSAEHLATALRCTYIFKDEIDGWDEALNVAYNAFKNIGVDPQDALYGMIET